MIRITNVSFFAILFCLSCNVSKNSENDRNVKKVQNQLVITPEGDSLETGFWTFDMSVNGVAKSGNFVDGYKTGKWTYLTNFDTASITWHIFDDKGVKFNIPDNLKPIENVSPPALFQGDIIDNDNNTYVVLLRYNLAELNSSIHDYLYQYAHSWEGNSNERVKLMEFKELKFKKIDIFRAKVETERKISYESISYVFVVKGFLYDLTYKYALNENSALKMEVFNDILYSMECHDFDLFNFNNKKYLKEENVVVK